MKPDLTMLYSELGLRPNCSLAELQLAYRRRISELQSDRTAGSVPAPEVTAVLRDLISLYTTASRFHRRYGRLPGAAPQRQGVGHIVYGGPRRAPTDDADQPSADASSSRSPVALGAALTLLVLLFALLALASGDWLH
ncbi:hypothetical protein [Agrilutibacter solisilvae]|uniref:J domain-containing protein n=1 Tax=Agrilutibacter solisilvae TaxID=2763317 RepID=A0A974XZ97_9GAMM|nr:hypothetical protein [Lysobacter solisilvae]QSX77690.1 hypothetical protein I8J32_013205 [Lysobacter solisilvae]